MIRDVFFCFLGFQNFEPVMHHYAGNDHLLTTHYLAPDTGTVKLWTLELACLDYQGSLNLVRRSRQFPHTFNVKIHPRLEQRWLQLSNSKHGPQGEFFM